MSRDEPIQRTIGLLGATGIGVGAIVGGGILALAGVAFATTGPGALVAFAFNGVIALLTALSFAEMSAAFPESGGTYTFAKKVLSLRSAFMVGWVVWFASIVASVLYALGFATFAMIGLRRLMLVLSGAGVPLWMTGHRAVISLAVGATAVYAVKLMRRAWGGGKWETVGKLLVFAVIIGAGAWAMAGKPLAETRAHLDPFLPHGLGGLLQAMGYTFIALQGFDLIAAVAGEVRNPGRTLPRAMILSLAAAMLVYLPLLLVLSTVGVAAGDSITATAAADMEGVVAHAVQRFLGPSGFWLVIVAAILSMLSALNANLLAASRVAQAMAGDRNLPQALGTVDPRSGTPTTAVLTTALTVATIIVLIPDVAAAGAVSSLIFLLSFAIAHWTAILARMRSRGRRQPFRVPFFPAVPVVGMAACLALAVFQGATVPPAGFLTCVWLAIGGMLFASLFARRARVVDASAEALDPDLVRLRGRSPLVLVPIANPASAAGLVGVASALAPPAVGRVLMMSVVTPPERWVPGECPQQLVDAQAVLREALTASFASKLAPEALTTVSEDPWSEIVRVSRTYRCESLLVGLGRLTGEAIESRLERLIGAVESDVVILRAAPGWRLEQVQRILVPVGGHRDHSTLRARLLGSLCRADSRDITYLGIVPSLTSRGDEKRLQRELEQFAEDEVGRQVTVEVARADDVASEVVKRSAACDLLVLGMQRVLRNHRVFGPLPTSVARETTCPLLMISRRG